MFNRGSPITHQEQVGEKEAFAKLLPQTAIVQLLGSQFLHMLKQWTAVLKVTCLDGGFSLQK